MNLIKTLIRYAFYTLLVAVFYGCTNKVNEVETISSDFKMQNIDVKGGWQYQIITYKGHEYLCNSSNGGMIHTESCDCRNGN
tara:strand:- start:1120 stop:1365 length:246 start_codon:yes stop_codon:yes gene_type:complete